MANRDVISGKTVKEMFPNLGKDAGKFPVREGESKWTADEAREVADALLTESHRLDEELRLADAELTEFLRNSGEGSGDDQADYGSSALEREQELALLNNTRDVLEQNLHALARIGLGTLGSCENCEKPVGKARQQAFPRATLCVECKQRQERG